MKRNIMSISKILIVSRRLTMNHRLLNTNRGAAWSLSRILMMRMNKFTSQFRKAWLATKVKDLAKIITVKNASKNTYF